MEIQLLVLGVVLLAVPLLAGGIFVDVDKSVAKLPFQWISGQLCLWAGFQLICVPFVLLEKKFSYVAYLFLAYSALMAILGAVRLAVYYKKRKADLAEGAVEVKEGKPERAVVGWWIVFAVLLAFQLVQAVRMTYADGDDAFYVGISTTAADSELMYSRMPYTGDGMEAVDVRHGLAPFPIWISYLTWLSGMEAVMVSHLVISPVLIVFSYACIYLLGRHLFPAKDEKLPLFLCFAELLVLFGDYSFYSVENFMIARSRQGKAALGSIVIPFLFYLLLLGLKRMENQEKISVCYYLLFAAGMLTGCLCSTMGALLVCLLAAIVGATGAMFHRRWIQLVPMALCCVPCVCYAVLYLIHG